MTSEPHRRGLGVGGMLTALLVAACVIVLTGLGVWQVKRLHWKEDLLRRVAAAQKAAPTPIGPVLARFARGEDVEWIRVAAHCVLSRFNSPQSLTEPWPSVGRYGVYQGEIVWRDTGDCWLDGAAPFDAIVIDRGVIDRWRGQVKPPYGAVRLPAPVDVTGVLRRVDKGDAAVASVIFGHPPRRPAIRLVVDHEDQPPPGVTPAPYPSSIPNNHLGYALTWFGLALALLGVYAGAMIKRRGRP